MQHSCLFICAGLYRRLHHIVAEVFHSGCTRTGKVEIIGCLQQCVVVVVYLFFYIIRQFSTLNKCSCSLKEYFTQRSIFHLFTTQLFFFLLSQRLWWHLLIHGTILEFDGQNSSQWMVAMDSNMKKEQKTNMTGLHTAPVVSSKFMEDEEVQFATKHRS